MTQEIVLREHVAIGQKLKSSTSPWGEGFNFIVEITLAPMPAATEESVRQKIRSFLARIDHKALGVDKMIENGEQPSALAGWLTKGLAREVPHFKGCRWMRGDGVVFISGSVAAG